MSDVSARVSTVTKASPADVWEALVTPAKLQQYFFGAHVESDWKVGSPIRMTGTYQGKTYEDKGKILAADPGKRLSFSHWSGMSGTPDTPDNYHVVTFDLARHGGGTEVTLTQTNLIGGVTPSDIAHKADYEKNWRAVLDGLAKVVDD
jgi:uncharacterized protein YndB with AHSA1/START domain